ncbi:MAG TPA: ATP-binding protein, partial [Gemmatimonadaceae bacterium]|nr:ATP-binding protein [Gemmatimonadaceae bacterium]
LLALVTGGAYAFVVHATRARTDASARDALADLRSQLLAERRDQASTSAAAREVLHELRFRTIAFMVFDASGRVVAASIPAPPPASASEDSEPPFDATRLGMTVAAAPVGRAAFMTLPDEEGGYRVALAPLTEADGRFTLAAATSVHEDMETLAEARTAVAIAGPLALLLAWAGGWLLARRSLQPMVRMRDATARIGASNLGERVPLGPADDEVGQLAAVINELLARLERSFAQQQQFMADASHELRTPVTVVKNEAALALSAPRRTAEEYKDALVVVRAAATRLQRIVDDLFFLSRADAGELPVLRQPLYFDELAADCVREVRSLAGTRGVTLALVAPAEAPLIGDESLLHRLVINLLDNAIKYSGPHGRIDVRLSRDGGFYRIEVENTGPPIPPEVGATLFERFVRGDAARSHDADLLTSGAGLGLSIARWIAQAHGGTLELARSDEGGTLFVLRLPL